MAIFTDANVNAATTVAKQAGGSKVNDALGAAGKGAAAGAAIGSVLPGIGTAIGGVVGGIVGAAGKLFGKKKPDASLTGYLNFMATSNRNQAWPSKEQLVNLAVQNGWPADNIDPIRNTYNQQDGTFQKGDWHAAITMMNPLTVTWFKGASEKSINVLNQSAQDAVFQTLQPSPIAQAGGGGGGAAQAAVFGGTNDNSQKVSGGSSGATGLKTWWSGLSGLFKGLVIGGCVVAFFIFILILKKLIKRR